MPPTFNFLMRNDILGHFLFRRSFFESILDLCWTRRKRLYILQEINPRWLQMKKCFSWKTRVVIKTPGKSKFFYRRNQVFAESIKEKGSMYEHFPLCGSAWGAIWGRLLKKEFSDKNRFSHLLTFLDFLGGWFCAFPNRFLWVCRDFGLEPWRKMMRRGQLSFWRK